MWPRRPRKQPPVDLTAGMPEHFTMPEEFLELARWSTEKGFTTNGVACLAEPDAEGCPEVWFGAAPTAWDGYLAQPDRVWQVATTGGDGSTLCLWLDDEGCQHVVHHGSGSGSVLFAIMPSPLAVLRLLAVGYEEPAFSDEWGESPEEPRPCLNPFRAWLRDRWGAEVPATGVEALGVETEAEAWTSGEGPDDAFARWLQAPGTQA